jgi:NADP-dependent 3-hydroxy acid dehydrogenase YdfG
VRVEAGTRALVTGASRGIGLAVARALAARGARLGMVARGSEALERAAAQTGDDAVPIAADVEDAAAMETAVSRFVAEAGGLEVVVANAGIARYAPFADQPLEDVERMVGTNVLGTLYTVRAALPHMLDRARGHIVVLSSGAGLRAFPWGAVYGATKAADRAFAEALRHELSGTGVSVTTVLPGEVATDLHEGRRDRLPDWRSSDSELPAQHIAEAIVRAIEEDARAIYLPAGVRLLGLNGLAPRLTDRLMAAIRGPTAAPRRD